MLYDGNSVLQSVSRYLNHIKQPLQHDSKAIIDNVSSNNIKNSCSDIVKKREDCDSMAEMRSMVEPVTVACGRLPALSAASEANGNEILDENGKNINQLIK